MCTEIKKSYLKSNKMPSKIVILSLTIGEERKIRKLSFVLPTKFTIFAPSIIAFKNSQLLCQNIRTNVSGSWQPSL